VKKRLIIFLKPLNLRGMKKITKTFVTALAILTTLTGISFAGSSTKKVDFTQTELTTVKAVEVTVGADVVSNYVYRGTLLDSNPVVAPHVSLSIPTHLSLPGVDDVTLKLDTTQVFGTKSPPTTWNRSEVSAGVALTKGRFTLTPSYQIVSSPNGNLQDAHGVGIKLEYDDSSKACKDTCKGIALKPYVSTYFGLEGNPGNGSKTGNYYEVGVAPSTKVQGVTVALPVAVGLGARGYYNNEKTYGYTSVGLNLSKEVAKNVAVVAGATYYNTDHAFNGKSDIVSTRVGFAVSF